MNPELHVNILADNYRRYFQESLVTVEEGESLYQKLWHADFVLLSHGTEDDPVFNFANLKAQALFEMDFATFTRLPSRYSAEPVTQEERDALLQQVSDKGCIPDYRGIRISASGKRFMIENARVWNLHAADGQYYGQAATFSDWSFIDERWD